jgi:hypothetical protein
MKMNFIAIHIPFALFSPSQASPLLLLMDIMSIPLQGHSNPLLLRMEKRTIKNEF